MKLKKKTKRRHRGLLLTGIIVLAAACLLVLFLMLFQVRKIEVTGNTYMAEADLAKWIQSDRYATNAFYIWAKYNFTEPAQHPNLEAIEVKLKNPWTVSIRVYEKKMVGFVYYQDNFVYFDREGYVLANDLEFRDGVPLIEGLSISGAELYKLLPVEDESIFASILEATQMLEKYEMKADRIICLDTELYLYFGTICARVGNTNLENRIIQIPPILEKLQDKRGLLRLENYQNADSLISFEENIWPDEIHEEEDTDGKTLNGEDLEETEGEQNE